MSYISQGTVSVDFDLNNNAAPTNLFFVASCDYSIKHRDENYAVFVDDRNQNQTIIRKDDGGGVLVKAAVPPELTLTNLPQAVARSSWIAIMFGVSKGNFKVEMRVDREAADGRDREAANQNEARVQPGRAHIEAGNDLYLSGIRVLTK